MSQFEKQGGLRRGWCPGALRPMESGDGLIVRVRPRCGALDLDAIEAIIEDAQHCGNGIIELTRRANLQLRGVLEPALPRLHATLRNFNLLDENARQESVRNIIVSPLSGIAADDLYDVRPIARLLEKHLRDDERLWNLPGKFGFLLDSGSKPDLDSERADMRLKTTRLPDGQTAFAIGLDRPSGNVWLGHTVNEDPTHLAALLARAAIALVTCGREASAPVTSASVTRMRHAPMSAEREIHRQLVQHLEQAGTHLKNRSSAKFERDRAVNGSRPPLHALLGVRTLASDQPRIGVAAPFGSLDAASWQQLVTRARGAGVSQIRLTPWRAVVLPMQDRKGAQTLLDALSQAGFITDANNPLLRIDACPGQPYCRSAHAQTRADARTLAHELTNTDNIHSVHVSGCAKGCARSARADCLLVAQPGGYAVACDAAHTESDAPVIPFANVTRGLEIAEKERTKRA